MLERREEYSALKREHRCDERTCASTIRTDVQQALRGQWLRSPRVKVLMEDVLTVWASIDGHVYVPGMGLLLTPFVAVLMSSELEQPLADLQVGSVLEPVLARVEADAFWCWTHIAPFVEVTGDPLQRLRELVQRIDGGLHAHLAKQKVDLAQFASNWVSGFFLRELSLPCAVRLWDTYIAEHYEGFMDFHVYVCASFLACWSSQLKNMDGFELMTFLQKLPTGGWRAEDVETLLAEAWVLKSCFHSAPNHLS